MKYSRELVNTKFGELCEKYDLDHWAWVPLDFILPSPKKEAAFLAKQEAFFKSCRRLDAVFLPGGDPGDNHTKELMPYAERMAPCCGSITAKPRSGFRCSGLSEPT